MDLKFTNRQDRSISGYLPLVPTQDEQTHLCVTLAYDDSRRDRHYAVNLSLVQVKDKGVSWIMGCIGPDRQFNLQHLKLESVPRYNGKKFEGWENYLAAMAKDEDNDVVRQFRTFCEQRGRELAR